MIEFKFVRWKNFVSYGDALTEVRFDSNKATLVIGDNGAGKSTFMKILSGAYQAESGRIIFEGKEVEIKNPKQSREIGIEMVYQDFALCRRLDIASNLFLGRELYRSFGIKFLKKNYFSSLCPSPILHNFKSFLITSSLFKIDLASNTQPGFLSLFEAISQFICEYSFHSVRTTTASEFSSPL